MRIPLMGLFLATLSHAAAPLTGDPVDCVNPLSGTDGDAEFSRGNTLAAIVAPFGMTTWAPQTEENAGPFYQMKHQQWEGLRATHQPSIWIRDYANFLITPVVGPWKGTVRDRASTFSHDREEARPYHYSVFLDRYETTFEITPSERCALLRITYPATDQAKLVFHTEGELEIDAARGVLRGKATHVTFGAPDGFGKYFVVHFDHPIASSEIERDGNISTLAVAFAPLADGDPVHARIGTSFIDSAQAERNLASELPDFSYEAAKQRAREMWSRELSRFAIQGASDDQKSTFYTALYRSFQFPRMFHERNAEGQWVHYSPFAQGQTFKGPLYTDNGLWDTYRAAFPLLLLAAPDRSASILEGWLNAYREGGRLPNWPSPGNRPCMIGSHSDSIFADAWVKGLRTFDLTDAWNATRKNAYENDPAGWAGRDHLDEYRELGFVPADRRKDAATSCTLEYAYGDYCVSRIARAAGHETEFEELMKRAGNYRHVWDPETGFMRGRLSDGSWQEPFDPLAWGGAFVEGNAWQWLWSVQHDPYGLIQLLGGPEKLASKLDAFLALPSTPVVGSYGHLIHEMREVEKAEMGQYAHVNEPDHHVLFLYCFAGQPWKTQKAVRRVMDELYDIHGMFGDEDTGQMSAWYVFNAAGFYPFCPGSPHYLIGSPLFEETSLQLPGGASFTVRAHHNQPDHPYIQSARLNGKPFTRSWISHETLTAGGLLEFEMGPQPNPQWGSQPADLPPNDFR
ncbi:putative alpha-1,2-mannosidase [Haloferula luteola]|uniref:Putative alpha-1,2-mannosidase n=1 Tax=Haloferula luteola TaxID=595692 RepID=A0A840VCP5_9BACT|nr:GH92 family glycosyl hydrolase [Haloferula luteola]MBB5351579.1 putative alpha-1,2-mannosidase [Haloferula luteola]